VFFGLVQNVHPRRSTRGSDVTVTFVYIFPDGCIAGAMCCIDIWSAPAGQLNRSTWLVHQAPGVGLCEEMRFQSISELSRLMDGKCSCVGSEFQTAGKLHRQS